jgi:hypothetical protein
MARADNRDGPVRALKRGPVGDIPASKHPQPKAKHGTPSEVSWSQGAGRQPYANQEEPEQARQPDADHEFSEGDRGEQSGRNLEQLEQVKKKP